jgi:hypothetical protein
MMLVCLVVLIINNKHAYAGVTDDFTHPRVLLVLTIIVAIVITGDKRITGHEFRRDLRPPSRRLVENEPLASASINSNTL